MRASLILAGLFLAATSAPVLGQSYPFSEAVRADNLLFLSGQIGIDPATGVLAPGGIEAETRQTMENIRATLARHDLQFTDLVQCRVFLADMKAWPAFNRVYASFFPSGKFPARSALGANGLALGSQVEIECTAKTRESPKRTKGLSSAPYSEAVAAAGLLHISGVIPFDPKSRHLAPPDMKSQMAQAFANLDRVLSSAGLSRKDIVSATVYLRTASDKPAMDAAWAKYFDGANFPARTTVPGIDWGRDDLRVEISAVAALGEQSEGRGE